MSQVLQLLLWFGIVAQLLLGIHLVGEVAQLWSEAFEAGYQAAVCGRYGAMEANLRDAVTTWRKLGCGGEDDMTVDGEVEALLLDWKEYYGDWDPATCGQDSPRRVQLHRERNVELDLDYPNWVVRYE